MAENDSTSTTDQKTPFSELSPEDKQAFIELVAEEVHAKRDAEYKAEADRLARTWPLEADDYSQPFGELIHSAGRTRGFTEGDPALLRQTVSNLRGLKDRAIEAIGALSNEMYDDWNHHREGDRFGTVLALTLLSDMAQDLEREERAIIDRMIDGDPKQGDDEGRDAA